MEVDAILAKVGNERFFQYILDTLKEVYPKRDYNRAIGIPDEEFGAEHEKIIKLIFNRVKDVTSPESDEIKMELSEVEGFLNVNDKVEEIKERFVKTLSENSDYDDFIDKWNKLVKSHPFCKKKKDSTE